jgi:N5-(cytidine 5'-diphosphoramidyl)-L-glutamine hydrolase
MLALMTEREVLDKYGEESDLLVRHNPEYANSLGFATLAVPNCPDAAREIAQSVDYRLLFITGGGFASAEYFEGDISDASFQPLRDEVERILVADAISKGIPVLGLCRGMFMLNGILGGKVLRGGSHSAPRHDHYVRFSTGERALVNTYHNSAIPARLLAPGVELLAVEEGTENVEAFRDVEKRILGLQWHPERPLPSVEGQTATNHLMNWLLNGVELPAHLVS